MKTYQLIKRVNNAVKVVDNQFEHGYTAEEAHRELDKWAWDILGENRDGITHFADFEIEEMRADGDACEWYEGEGWYYTDDYELVYKKGSDHLSFDTTTIDIEDFDALSFWASELEERLFGHECDYTTKGGEPREMRMVGFTADGDIVRITFDPLEYGAEPVFIELTAEQCKDFINRYGIRLEKKDGTWEQIDF